MRLRSVLLIPTLLTLGLSLLTATPPEEPFVVGGGASPDNKLAIVVFGDINWNSPEADKATEQESHAYLYNETLKKIIGPLEEVDVDGGTWGTTQGNVHASWSPDGQFVAVTFRGGRMIHDFVVYKISPFSTAKLHEKSFRATPQKLPTRNEGPNSSIVFQNTTNGPNSGEGVEGWQSNTRFSTVVYGLRLQKFDQPGSEAINSQGQIRIVYEYSGQKWTIKEFQKVPDNY